MKLPKGTYGLLISIAISLLLYLLFAGIGVFAVFFIGGPVIWYVIEKYLTPK